MARGMNADTVDFYRYLDETGRWAYGPYDTRAMPRRYQNENDGKGKIQKLAPSFDADGNFYCLTWVDIQ